MNTTVEEASMSCVKQVLAPGVVKGRSMSTPALGTDRLTDLLSCHDAAHHSISRQISVSEARDSRLPSDYVVLTLCGCIGMPLKSVTILLAEAMCTGRMPVRRPFIWSSLHRSRNISSEHKLSILKYAQAIPEASMHSMYAAVATGMTARYDGFCRSRCTDAIPRAFVHWLQEGLQAMQHCQASNILPNTDCSNVAC